MSEDTRIFPRYQTSNMKIQFESPVLKGKEFIIENVSLGGIRVSSENPVSFTPSFEASLKLGSQEFEITAYSVWKNTKSEKEDEAPNFKYGFRLVFAEEDHYHRWMTFMKALHQHQKKLAAKNS